MDRVLDALLDARLSESFASDMASSVAKSNAYGARQVAAGKQQLAASAAFNASKHPRASHGPGGGQFISSGAKGAAVAGVQHKVGVAADGKFGAQTRQAVINFQRAHGLKVDGVVGRQTAAALRGQRSANTVAPGALASSDLKSLTTHGARARSMRSRVSHGAGSSRKQAKAPLRFGGGVLI